MTVMGLILLAVGILIIYSGVYGTDWLAPVKHALGAGTATAA